MSKKRVTVMPEEDHSEELNELFGLRKEIDGIEEIVTHAKSISRIYKIIWKRRSKCKS